MTLIRKGFSIQSRFLRKPSGKFLCSCFSLVFFVFIGFHVLGPGNIESTSDWDNQPASGLYNDIYEVVEKRLQQQQEIPNQDGAMTIPSNPPGTCILDPSAMPESWNANHLPDSGQSWTADEQQRANDAVQKGIEELIAFYNSISVRRIRKLGTNAVNSLVDQCFSSKNLPRFHHLACEATARTLIVVADDYMEDLTRKGKNKCRNMHKKSKLLAYANYLVNILKDDARLRDTHERLIAVWRDSFHDCGSLSKSLEVDDWEAMLNNPRTPRKPVRDFVHNSNALTGLYSTARELNLPAELDLFTAKLWQYVAKYPFIYARDVPNGFRDSSALHMAYLVTHIAYMPTGYGRHMQYVEDAPWLYKYIRENFYAAKQSGDLDLMSEFVDILRQYGCTEDNDYMVRYGSRYVLNMYTVRGQTWMPSMEGRAKPPKDYYTIHLPWTTIAALRRKQVEPLVPGSYGYNFLEALKRAGAAADTKNSMH